MPGGFPNFRSVPEVYQKPRPVAVKPSGKSVNSSGASFQSDAETLRNTPREKTLLRSIIDAMNHIAPKQ